MVVRARVSVTETSAVDGIIDNAPEIVRLVADDVVSIYEPQIKRILAQEPPPAKHPFQFATAKSRRWYFAAVRGKIPGVTINTDGTRYVRTGGLSAAWDVRVDEDRRGVTIVVDNPTRAAVYVGGSMSLTNPSRAARRQVPGHRNTGWPLWVSVLNPLMESVQTEFKLRYSQALDGKGTAGTKVRGYSRRIKR